MLGKLYPQIFNEVTSIKSGDTHTLFLTSTFSLPIIGKGKVYSFGGGLFGNCSQQKSIGEQGNGAKTTCNKEPFNIRFPKPVRSISAGGHASGAITASSDLYLWGENFYGNLPFSSELVLAPSLVGSGELFGARISSVSLSLHHTLFVTSEGSVFACGSGSSGKLGQGNTEDQHHVPRLIEGLNNIKGANCSDGHSMAYNYKRVYTWGGGYNGRLGHGIVNSVERVCSDLSLPKRVPLDCNIYKVGCGDKYSVVLGEDMRLRVAGNLDSKKVWHKNDFVLRNHT